MNSNTIRRLSHVSAILCACGAQAQVITESHKLIANDAGDFDSAGSSIAIDAGVAVMSVIGDDDQGSAAGAAILFDALSGAQLHKLHAPDGSAGDGFSKSVAIKSGVVVIGADGDDDQGDSSGSAYVFNASNGVFAFKLTPPDGAQQDFFGTSVATDGGYILVGSPRDDDSGMNAGSVYMYNATTGSYIRKITAPDGASEDRFGTSVAIGDGIIVVGSPLDDDQGLGSGSVYLFSAADGSFIRKLLASDGAPDDNFGQSVSIDSEVICVGSPLDDDGGSGSGSAYLFGTSGTQLHKLFPTDSSGGDSFGYSVAIKDNAALCGAYSKFNSGFGVGTAYLFDVSNGDQVLKLNPSAPSNGLNLGISVALDETTLLCGARYDDEAAGDSGAVYVYEAPAPPCAPDLNDDGELDFFDVSEFLSTTPDWNGDTTFDFFDVSGFLSAFGAGCP